MKWTWFWWSVFGLYTVKSIDLKGCREYNDRMLHTAATLGDNVRMYALQRTAQVFSYAEHGVVAQLEVIITEMRN